MALERKSVDVCVVGSGIVATLLAAKLSEQTDASIMLIEAGEHLPWDKRPDLRDRFRDYAENPWPGDSTLGHTMIVGGRATHWDGYTPRFTPEDFRLRSSYGVSLDWPLSYDDIEPYYCEAEQRIGVSGAPDDARHGRRSQPFPTPALPLAPGLQRLRGQLAKHGLHMQQYAMAKNSRPYGGRPACSRCEMCYCCPTGARYSPDFTLRQLVDSKKVSLLSGTVVRQLVLHDKRPVVTHALLSPRGAQQASTRVEARYFVLAGGYYFTPHLLLSSACARFPQGLANSSGLVGYVTGHPPAFRFFFLDGDYSPLLHRQSALHTRQHMSPPPAKAGKGRAPLRFDLAVRVAEVARYAPMVKGNKALFGDELLATYRRSAANKTDAWMRAYVSLPPPVDPRKEPNAGRVVLAKSNKTPWGMPAPELVPMHNDVTARCQRLIKAVAAHEASKALASATAGTSPPFVPPRIALQHVCGSARMGKDPATSVCAPTGRAHDHENVYIAGAPAMVSAGCTNGTLTFVALALKSAADLAARLGNKKKRP